MPTSHLRARSAALTSPSVQKTSAPRRLFTHRQLQRIVVGVGLLAMTGLSGCAAVNLQQGGRLYDRWYADKGFRPDNAKTPKVDGHGGPRGDGTLLDERGQPMSNKTGHNFRFKSLWGWDLRGAAGIYGPAYQNKSTVRPENLLTDPRTPAQLTTWFREGGQGLPAWGSVMTEDEIQLVVAFIDAMRTGRLPRASDIWKLSKDAPKNYTLLPGGDPVRGAKLVRQRCTGCHGDKGMKLAVDKHYSLGAFARSKGYEAWFKMLSGQPGTPMHGQLPEGLNRKQSASFVLDILAGLCDRTQFPPLANGKDVADGDVRCGVYLK